MLFAAEITLNDIADHRSDTRGAGAGGADPGITGRRFFLCLQLKYIAVGQPDLVNAAVFQVAAYGFTDKGARGPLNAEFDSLPARFFHHRLIFPSIMS